MVIKSSQLFPTKDIEELLEFVLAYGNNSNSFLNLKEISGIDFNEDEPFFYVNTKNYRMLEWYFTKIKNMPVSEMYKNIDKKYLNIVKQKNENVPNKISLIIFNNIFNYFKDLELKKINKNKQKLEEILIDKKINKMFYFAGIESAKKFGWLSSKLLLYLKGRRIKDIVESLEYINYKYNNTKFFSYRSEFKSNSKIIKVKITPIHGIINPNSFIEWNAGIYHSFLKTSIDKIINEDYYTLEDGSWEYVVEYKESNKRNYGFKFIRNYINKLCNNKEIELRKKQALVVSNSLSKLEKLLSTQELIDNKHLPSGEHNNDVTFVALKFGKDLNFTTDELVTLGLSAYIHDIGKSTIPHEILSKPGKFNKEEWEVMKTHYMSGLSISLAQGYSLEESLGTIEHHFRANGTGYENIDWKKTSKFGLVLQIADVYSALMAKRSYKNGANDLNSNFSSIKVYNLLKNMGNKGDFYKPYIDYFLKYTFYDLEKIRLNTELTPQILGYFREVNYNFKINKFNGIHPNSKSFLKNKKDATKYMLDYFFSTIPKLNKTYYEKYPHIRIKYILNQKKISKITGIRNEIDLNKFRVELNSYLNKYFPMELKEKKINNFNEYIDYLNEFIL